MNEALLQRSARFALLLAGVGLAAPGGAWAVRVDAPASKIIPCGTLSSVGGEVQLLDASRTELLDTRANADIPCGSWLSTESGWAILVHRDGHRVRVGAKAFVEVLDSGAESRNPGDHVVVYKGQVHAKAAHDSNEFRALTANGRVRMKSGESLIVFSPLQEETQLIALSDSSSLENRFEGSRRVTVKAGEATSLDMKTLRIVPSTPRVVSLTALKMKLDDVQLDDDDQRGILRAAKSRKDRTLAITLKDAGSRAPASEKRDLESYERHPGSEQEKANLKERWAERLTGGDSAGKELLFPKKSKTKAGRSPASAKVTVEDVAKTHERKLRDEEKAEKERLMRELSTIRPE